MERLNVAHSSHALNTLEGKGTLLCEKDTGAQNISDRLAPVVGSLMMSVALTYEIGISYHSFKSSGP